MAYKTRSMTKKTDLGKLVGDIPIVPLTALSLAAAVKNPNLAQNKMYGLLFPLGITYLIQEDRKPKSKQTVDISGKGLLNDLALYGLLSYTFFRFLPKFMDTLVLGPTDLLPPLANGRGAGTSFDQAYGRQS